MKKVRCMVRNAPVISGQLELRGKGQSVLKIYLCNKVLHNYYEMLLYSLLFKNKQAEVPRTHIYL